MFRGEGEVFGKILASTEGAIVCVCVSLCFKECVRTGKGGGGFDKLVHLHSCMFGRYISFSLDAVCSMGSPLLV